MTVLGQKDLVSYEREKANTEENEGFRVRSKCVDEGTVGAGVGTRAGYGQARSKRIVEGGVVKWVWKWKRRDKD